MGLGVKKVLTDEDIRDRAAIDGRAAFAAAAFAFAALLVALLDRVGVPEAIVGVLGPIFAMAGLACLGFLLRSMRISRFYAAGRAVPSTYAGLGLASLAAGLFAPFVPPVPSGVSMQGLLWGFGGGLALAALVTGPFLRKTGAFSITDLLTARFPSLSLRLALMVIVAVIGLQLTFASTSTAIDQLVSAFAMGRGTATLLTGAVLLFIVVPGGTSGVIWSAAGAAGLVIVGFALPLVLLAIGGTPLPAPIFGDTAAWSAAVARMSSWHGVAPETADVGRVIVVALALGTGVLAPLLAPAIGCRKQGTARRAGLSALAWATLIVLLVATTMAVSTLALETALETLRPDNLPDYIYRASARGLVGICGAAVDGPAAARAACASLPGFKGVLRPGDFVASGGFLVVGLPALRHFGVALSGLVIAGTIAVSLALAAASLHAVAVSVGHDVLYRVRDASALTSRRLAATRIVQIVALLICATWLWRHSVDARALIGLSVALSGATIAPLLMLTLWPRAGGTDAILALFTSIAFGQTIILIGSPSPSLETLAIAALAGCGAGLFAGIASSLLRPADPTGPGGIFVDRVLHGASDVLNPDKGA